MGLTAIVTNAGRAALVNAANTGTRAVTIAQVGLSGTALAPEAGATVLPGQFKTIATLSGDVVADDTIHLIVRDESADIFTVRSLALYLADGTLFAIYGQADVLLEKSAQALMLLAIDIRFEDVDASAITFGDTNFLNPPATTERQGVVELATVAEAQAGIDALRALTPQAARSAILGWLLAQDGAGSGLDADLLDGQQGSFFTDIPGRLGFTPANRAGDTFTGQIRRDANFYIDLQTGNPILNFDAYDYLHFDRTANRLNLNVGGTVQAYCGPDGYLWARSGITVGGQTVWHAGNDGSGSGLDADLLDGLDSSYYVNVPARLGYTPVNKAGDTFTGLVSIQGVGLAAGIRCYNTVANRDYRVIQKDDGSLQITDETDGVVRFAITSSGAIYHGTSDLMWHSGNDGAGSGLDADLLDGLDSSYYTNIPARLGYTPANKAGDTFTGPVTVPGLTNTNGRSYLGADDSGNHWLAALGITSEPGRLAYGFCASNGTITRHTFMVGGAARLIISDTSMLFNSSLVWNAGNDGAGSGMDADLLDGQQGSWYTDIPSRLGYSPINRAGDTLTETIRYRNTDASPLASRPSTTTALHVTTVEGGPALMSFERPNAYAGFLGIDTDNRWKVGGWSMGAVAHELWHSGNDGSGSGLDADLLDGFQADAFARITAQSIGSTGYMVLSNGLKIVYGTVPLTQDAYSYATFPIAFESAPAVVFPTIDTVNNSSDQNTLLTARTMNGFTVFQAADISNVSLPYIAIGR